MFECIIIEELFIICATNAYTDVTWVKEIECEETRTTGAAVQPESDQVISKLQQNPCTWHKSCCPKWECPAQDGLIGTCQGTTELATFFRPTVCILVKWVMAFYCMMMLELLLELDGG